MRTMIYGAVIVTAVGLFTYPCISYGSTTGAVTGTAAGQRMADGTAQDTQIVLAQAAPPQPYGQVTPPQPCAPVPPPQEGPPGEWVEVPGSWVDGKWVPAHRTWVPLNPDGSALPPPTGQYPPPQAGQYPPPPPAAQYPPPPAYALPGPPEVMPIPGTYAYYVPGINVDIFFHQGYWYRPFGGRWYRSAFYNGPWLFVPGPRVPRVLVALPPGWRRVPPGYHPIPHAELQRNWQRWERERHWDHHHGWR